MSHRQKMAPRVCYAAFSIVIYSHYALAFRLELIDREVTVDQRARVRWIRDNRDPKIFILLGRNGDERSGKKHVLSLGRTSDEVEIKMDKPGEFVIELYAGLDRSPRASSDGKILVTQNGNAPASSNEPATPTEPAAINEPAATNEPANINEPAEASSPSSSVEIPGAGASAITSVTTITTQGDSIIETITFTESVTFVESISSTKSGTLTSATDIAVGSVSQSVIHMPSASPSSEPTVPSPTETAASPAVSSSDSKTAVIVGSVLGSFLFLVILFFCVRWYLRRRRSAKLNHFFQRKISAGRRSIAPSTLFRQNPFRSHSFTSRAASSASSSPGSATPDLEKSVAFDPAKLGAVPTLSPKSGPSPPSREGDPYSRLYDTIYSKKSEDEVRAPPPMIITTPASPPPTILYKPSPELVVSPEPKRPTLPSIVRTDRQMEIHEKLVQLKTQLIQMQAPQWESSYSEQQPQDHQAKVKAVKEKIDTLEKMLTSSWALGLTDMIPKGFY